MERFGTFRRNKRLSLDVTADMEVHKNPLSALNALHETSEAASIASLLASSTDAFSASLSSSPGPSPTSSPSSLASSASSSPIPPFLPPTSQSSGTAERSPRGADDGTKGTQHKRSRSQGVIGTLRLRATNKRSNSSDKDNTTAAISNSATKKDKKGKEKKKKEKKKKKLTSSGKRAATVSGGIPSYRGGSNTFNENEEEESSSDDDAPDATNAGEEQLLSPLHENAGGSGGAASRRESFSADADSGSNSGGSGGPPPPPTPPPIPSSSSSSSGGGGGRGSARGRATAIPAALPTPPFLSSAPPPSASSPITSPSSAPPSPYAAGLLPATAAGRGRGRGRGRGMPFPPTFPPPPSPFAVPPAADSNSALEREKQDASEAVHPKGAEGEGAVPKEEEEDNEDEEGEEEEMEDEDGEKEQADDLLSDEEDDGESEDEDPEDPLLDDSANAPTTLASITPLGRSRSNAWAQNPPPLPTIANRPALSGAAGGGPLSPLGSSSPSSSPSVTPHELPEGATTELGDPDGASAGEEGSGSGAPSSASGGDKAQSALAGGKAKDSSKKMQRKRRGSKIKKTISARLLRDKQERTNSVNDLLTLQQDQAGGGGEQPGSRKASVAGLAKKKKKKKKKGGKGKKDWSDFEERAAAKEVLEDPLATQILLFPPNEILVLREARESRTLSSALPADLVDTENNPPWLNACYETFTEDWTLVKYNHPHQQDHQQASTAASASASSTTPASVSASSSALPSAAHHHRSATGVAGTGSGTVGVTRRPGIGEAVRSASSRTVDRTFFAAGGYGAGGTTMAAGAAAAAMRRKSQEDPFHSAILQHSISEPPLSPTHSPTSPPPPPSSPSSGIPPPPLLPPLPSNFRTAVGDSHCASPSPNEGGIEEEESEGGEEASLGVPEDGPPEGSGKAEDGPSGISATEEEATPGLAASDSSLEEGMAKAEGANPEAPTPPPIPAPPPQQQRPWTNNSNINRWPANFKHSGMSMSSQTLPPIRSSAEDPKLQNRKSFGAALSPRRISNMASVAQGGKGNLPSISSSRLANNALHNSQHQQQPPQPQSTSGGGGEVQLSSLSPRNFEIFIDENICNNTYNEEMLTKSRTERNKERLNIFSDGPPKSPRKSPKERPIVQPTSGAASLGNYVPIQPFASAGSTRLLVSCSPLQFQLGQPYEPLFCSLSLYDVSTKEKISETFHWDFHQDSERNALAMAAGFTTLDKETMATKAMFTVYNPSPAVHLILRIEKLLLGDLDKDLSFYLKPKACKVKDLQRLASEVSHLISNSKLEGKGLPLQPFAWAAIPLFTDTLALRATGTIKVDQIVPIKGAFDDETLFDVLNSEKKDSAPVPLELRREPKSNIKRVIAAYMDLNIRRVNDEVVKNCVDSSFLHVHPFSPSCSAKEIIREIDSFEQRPEPCISYINTLYVYPEVLNLRAQSSYNIQVEVRLKEGDADPDSNDGLMLICGRSSGPRFLQTGVSSVTFHEKKPRFYDEIKVKLPGRLTNKHHLLFSFFHVNPNPKKEAQLCLGHAVLPLFSEDFTVSCGRFTLPVVKELKSGYLGPLKGLMGKHQQTKSEQSFAVQTKLLSSVYPQDKHLCQFAQIIRHPPLARKKLEMIHGPMDIESWNFALKSSESEILRGVQKIDKHTCVKFMPTLLNQLFCILCTHENAERRKDAMQGIIHVIKSVQEEAGAKSDYSPSLASYAKYMFSNVAGAQHYIYEEVCKFWLALLESKHQLMNGFMCNRFLLEIIAKSMVLKIHATGEISDESTRRTRFSPSFHENLSKLVRTLFAGSGMQSLDAIASFPILLRNLLSITDRGLVFNMIYRHMKADQARLGKFKFLQILLDYEHYIPLNLPRPQRITSLDVDQLINDFWSNHFLAGLLLKEVEATSKDESAALRTQGIITLRNMLKKHDTDERYAYDEQVKSRIADLYFPYLLILMERMDVVLVEKEKDDWLLCFIYIVKNCSKDLLKSWWKRDTQKRQISFLRLLASCLKAFEAGMQCGGEVCMTTLDVLMDFMIDFEEELIAPGSELIGPVLTVVHRLLQASSEYFLSCLYSSMQFIVHRFKKPLFRYPGNSKFCEMLSYEILRHCNFRDVVIRTKASSLFFLLLKKNFEEMGHVSRMKVQSTVAVSRLVGGVKGASQNLTTLQGSLKAVGAFSKKFSKQQNEEFAALDAEVQELISRMFRLINYSAKIAENMHDPETTADLYLKISDDYFDSPDLRVRWLENLSEFQVTQNNLEEAAQCKLHVAALVEQYLIRSGKLKISDVNFSSIAPNVKTEVSLPDIEDDGNEEDGPFQDLGRWSINGLTSLLKEASSLLQQAKSYELCIEVLMLLTALYKSERKYEDLINTLDHFKAMTKTLVEANKDLRIFPTYFRVGFYGRRFEDLDGREFIYRVPGETRLGHIQNQLKQKHCSKVGGNLDNVVILQNKTVDPAKFEADKVYIQIGGVDAYFPPEEAAFRVTPHETNFGISQFIFESGFTESGKNVATGLGKQQKKKIIFTTALSFPYMKSRLDVTSTTTVILTPLENAIELLEGRVQALRSQLSMNPPRLNALQSVIQGSVVTSLFLSFFFCFSPVLPMPLSHFYFTSQNQKVVNEGPLKICEIFLPPDAVDESGQKYDQAKILVLKEKMRAFVKMCGFAIKLNKSLISAEHIPFQNMVEKRYETLKETVEEILAMTPG
ncbi:RasGEF domain-containing protein [Balamuthia mandrillaris]